MKKLILSLCALIFCANMAFSSEDIDSEVPVDNEKHYLVGLGGMLAFNIGLASWNRYMIGSDWAKTGWNEWNHFWERKMTWDRDWYWTNYFLHPYQGSMYYMSARGANLNKLESFGVTLIGSSMWEYLCERNAPSKNDMIYTTVGSFCVGEMFFRLSQEANGLNRLFGVALNPERLFTEYLCGVKQQNTYGRIHSMTVGFDLGNIVAGSDARGMSRDVYDAQEIYPVFGMLEMAVDYHDPYVHDSNDPYGQFSLYVHGGMGKGSGVSGPCAYENIDEKLFYDIRIMSDAMLLARTADFGENIDTSYGLTMIYDFEWHSYYMLSSLAPGFAFKQRINGDGSKIEWQAQLAAVLLGTTDYFYYHRDLDKNLGIKPDCLLRPYNNTIGGETLLKFRYATEKGHSFDVNFRGYAMYDFYDQLQTKNESEGLEWIGLLSASYELPVSEKVRIGVKDELYGKAAFYDSKNSVYQLVNTAKVFAKLIIK